MTPKTRRLEMRVDEATSEIIALAAAMRHETISAFVGRAARAEADRMLARSDTTIMSAEQFDALMGSLEKADGAPQLARVAARARRFQRA